MNSKELLLREYLFGAFSCNRLLAKPMPWHNDSRLSRRMAVRVSSV